MLKKLRKKLVSLIQVIFLIYLIMLIYLYFNQRNLMYHPNENNYIGDKISVRIEKVKINTSDNIDLLGWFHKKDLERYKTILSFHILRQKRVTKSDHYSKPNCVVFVLLNVKWEQGYQIQYNIIWVICR